MEYAVAAVGRAELATSDTERWKDGSQSSANDPPEDKRRCSGWEPGPTPPPWARLMEAASLSTLRSSPVKPQPVLSVQLGFGHTEKPIFV